MKSPVVPGFHMSMGIDYGGGEAGRRQTWVEKGGADRSMRRWLKWGGVDYFTSSAARSDH